MAAGLLAASTTGAQASVSQEAGPFWPGDLLSMSNADFEGGVGNWTAVSNSTVATSPNAFLHDQSLEITGAGTGTFTSVIQLMGKGGGDIQIQLPSTSPAPKYRVGAYIYTPAGSAQTTEFDLQCYNSAGQSLGWSLGSQVANHDTGTWQWVKDDIQLPSGCAYVQDSPRVEFTGMQAGDDVLMDEAWLAPQRAALMIGAYAQNYTTWNSDNTSIGPLQSDKIFFGGKNSPALPATWDSTHNQCHKIYQSTKPPPVCVINLNPQTSSGQPTVYSEGQIRKFLTGMPVNQTVIMVYHGEPEIATFANCPGSGPGNAANFRCYFKTEANDIRTAAADPKVNRIANVFTADDSASSQYDAAGDAHTCNWIVSPSFADVYLLDHYERGWANGNPLPTQGDNTNGEQQWNNWLGCVKNMDKPIGLAEYGLCSGPVSCNHSDGSASCQTEGSTGADEQTMFADNTYLAGEPSGTSPTLLWNYWYDGCWQFTDTAGINEWQSIENQNGGAVGG
jgi:hypothetical protein